MSGGFAAGVRSIDKTSKIIFATDRPAAYDDAAGGKRVATQVIAQGADVIFDMGDGASFGYLQAVETAKVGHKVWMIGDIGDLTPIDKKPRVPLLGALELHGHLHGGDRGHQQTAPTARTATT